MQVGDKLARCVQIALATILLVQCEALAPRVIPVQTSRTVQVESFRQRFHINSIPRAERVFQRILGMRNYDALSAAEWAPHMKALLEGNVEALGSVTFVMSLMPTNLDQFFIEGSGHYVVRDTSSSTALLSGTFELIDDGPRPLSELDEGVLDLRTRHTIVRHFAHDKPNYVNVTELGLRLHLRRLDEDLYITAYDIGHEVGMLGSNAQVETIGCLEFVHRADARKVIDMRGRNLIQDDYGERLDQAGFSPGAPVARHPWVPLRTCSGTSGDRSHCLCGPAGAEK